MDIQFVTESSHYLVNYATASVTKSEKSMMQVIWLVICDSKHINNRHGSGLTPLQGSLQAQRRGPVYKQFCAGSD